VSLALDVAPPVPRNGRVADHLALVPARRISAAGLARVLGGWRGRGPAYAALADAVRLALVSGAVPVGTRLPSERELAEHLGLSRTTTSAAYRRLREQRYLAGRRGAGSVLVLPTPPRPDAWRPDTAEGRWELDLSMTMPPLPPELTAAVAEALELLPAHAGAPSGYLVRGSRALREAIARRYTARGVPTDPEQVLVTTGAQHALHLLATVLCARGDRVVVEHPTYPNAIGVVRERGARPVPVPMTADGVDLDLLESTLRASGARAVYLVADNHNPTGVTLAAAARARVADLCRRHGAVLVLDETLADLHLDAPPDPDAAAAPERPGATVVRVGSASKSFWAGLRVGWVRAPAALVERLAAARMTSDIATAVLDQLALVRLLDREEVVLPRLRDELRARRDLLVDLLRARAPQWRFPTPAGGMVLWVDLGARASTSLAALAGEAGLRVPPGTRFGVDGSFDQFLRLSFGADPADLERAVDVLVAAWPRAVGSALPLDGRAVV